MSTKILFLTAYDMNRNGGVQNQINLMKNALIDLEYEVKICSSNSNDFNIGKSIKLPFNSSIASVTLFPDKKILQKAIAGQTLFTFRNLLYLCSFGDTHLTRKLLLLTMLL